MSKEPKSKSYAGKFIAPRKSSKGGGGTSQNVHMLDCGVDDFHPLARAKGGWRFAKYKFALSKDKTRKHKYIHFYIKRTVHVTRKITLRNNSEENARVHFAQKQRKVQISSLRAKSKKPRKLNHEVTSEISSSKISRSKSDMTSRTATSIISSAVRRRNASNSTPASEGTPSLRRAFVKNPLATIHEFMRSNNIFNRLWLWL